MSHSLVAHALGFHFDVHWSHLSSEDIRLGNFPNSFENYLKESFSSSLESVQFDSNQLIHIRSIQLCPNPRAFITAFHRPSPLISTGLPETSCEKEEQDKIYNDQFMTSKSPLLFHLSFIPITHVDPKKTQSPERQTLHVSLLFTRSLIANRALILCLGLPRHIHSRQSSFFMFQLSSLSLLCISHIFHFLCALFSSNFAVGFGSNKTLSEF